MKKVILIISALLCFAAVSVAQPRALGGRIGRGLDVSYEHSLGSGDFLEFEAGINDYDDADFHVDGAYNFILATPNWASSGSFAFYGGPGGAIAVVDDDDDHDDDTCVYAGFLGNLGLEYIFDFNLQISLDIRPRIMFGDGGVWSDGILSFGLGVRYAF